MKQILAFACNRDILQGVEDGYMTWKEYHSCQMCISIWFSHAENILEAFDTLYFLSLPCTLFP